MKTAGGFLVQLMPGAPDELIGKLEDNIFMMDQLTTILDEDGTDEVFRQVLRGFDYHLVQEAPVGYRCSCSRERVEAALGAVERSELKEMIAEDRVFEVSCQFCDAVYRFGPQELAEILRKSTEKKN